MNDVKSLFVYAVVHSFAMAAVVTVSDSDECGLDEDGIGKSLSKEDWKRPV